MDRGTREASARSSQQSSTRVSSCCLAPAIWRRGLTILLLAHFALIAVSYASNWRRSTLSDAILDKAQPYLLGLGFGLEMHSVEWSRAPEREQPIRVLLARSDSAAPAKIFLQSHSEGLDRFKKRQLLQFVATFLELFDEESATKLLASIVSQAARESIDFDTIVLEQRSSQHGEFRPLFQAYVISEEGVPPKFIPIIEPQRTMKGIPTGAADSSVPTEVQKQGAGE